MRENEHIYMVVEEFGARWAIRYVTAAMPYSVMPVLYNRALSDYVHTQLFRPIR